MRITFRLILSLVFVVTLAAAAFSLWRVPQWASPALTDYFLRVFVYALAIALMALVVVCLSVRIPIHKTTEWVKKVRLGEIHSRLNPGDEKLLGPLVNEVSKMAKSLQTARLAAGRGAPQTFFGLGLDTEAFKRICPDEIGRPLSFCCFK